MRELGVRAEALQEPHEEGGSEERKFAVQVLQRVRVVFYVTARNAVEAADKWLRDEYDDMDGPSRPISEDVMQVAEVRA
jgi:hypothetical protein